jgi:hypothetical protein
METGVLVLSGKKKTGFPHTQLTDQQNIEGRLIKPCPLLQHSNNFIRERDNSTY